MNSVPVRHKVHFGSGDDTCAAWHYPGTNGVCIVMAGGLAVPKEPGTDRFAARFHDAGYGVLAFDYRRMGQSSGTPRQVLPIADQQDDWRAAIEFARTLPGVDAGKLVLWGFSMAGGHLLQVAAGRDDLAGVIAQTPYAGGLAAVRAATRHQTLWALVRQTGLGLLDLGGALFGRSPLLVPLAAPRGTVAVLATPEAQQGAEALDPDNTYPAWIQAIAARSTLGLAGYRPGRFAKQVRVPLLVVVCDDDVSALAAAAVDAARAAPRGEVARFAGGHYAPFLKEHDLVVQAELDFLGRHLFATGPAVRLVGGQA